MYEIYITVLVINQGKQNPKKSSAILTMATLSIKKQTNKTQQINQINRKQSITVQQKYKRLCWEVKR